MHTYLHYIFSIKEERKKENYEIYFRYIKCVCEYSIFLREREKEREPGNYNNKYIILLSGPHTHTQTLKYDSIYTMMLMLIMILADRSIIIIIIKNYESYFEGLLFLYFYDYYSSSSYLL